MHINGLGNSTGKKFAKRFIILAANGVASVHSKDPSEEGKSTWGLLSQTSKVVDEINIKTDCSSVVANDMKWPHWPVDRKFYGERERERERERDRD